VEITAERSDVRLEVRVRDSGVGMPEGHVGQGLGTQIVRTLIQGELGGTIDWHTLVGSGTEVTIDIPMRYIDRSRA
jgi:two-component sensor histidine kinase